LNLSDYPAEYMASDQAAVKLERNYFRLLKAELLLFLTASVVGVIIAFPWIGYGRPLAVVAAILIAAAFLILWVMRQRRLEQKWFQYRAVAESVKTTTWRYMMQAPPFDCAESDTELHQKFIATLRAIQTDRAGRRPLPNRPDSAGNEISEFMRRKQKLSLEERKTYYLCERVADQQNWYEEKSLVNRRNAARWSSFILTTQVLALALALLRIVYPGVPLSPVSFLMTGASSMVAWTQARRHGDLIEPYAVAAQELKELEALCGSVTDSKSFCRFVSDVEETISREHTKWLARRSIETEKPNSEVGQ
jgi:hypothetical protein